MTTYKTILERNRESSTDTDISNDNIIPFDYPFDKKRYTPKSYKKTQTNIRKFVKEKADNIILFPCCPFDEKHLILKSNKKTQKVSNVRRKFVERKVDSAILMKNYEGLYDLLNKYESQTLDILYRKTQNREIDLGTPKGKQIWKKVIEFYKDNKEKLDLIYNFLAKYSRTKFQQHVYEFVYDIVAFFVNYFL